LLSGGSLPAAADPLFVAIPICHLPGPRTDGMANDVSPTRLSIARVAISD
jgi:hypothetical protein